MVTNTSTAGSGLRYDCGNVRSSRISNRQIPLAIFTFIVTLIIASGWLVFPYFVKGQNLLSSVGGDVKQEKLSKAISIGKFLNRTTFGAGEAQVDVLYATPEFFQLTDRSQVVAQYRPDLYHVFLVTETTHIEDLPRQLPKALLSIDGKEYRPFDVEGPLDVYHHRVVTIRFRAFLDDGTPILSDDSRHLELRLVNSWDPDSAPRTVSWDLPLAYPDELLDPNPWTLVMILGLSAGLLSFVLTPCLLQLLVVYVVTLTGFSTSQLQSDDASIPPADKHKLLMVALSFVAGFSAIFTLTGAAIGQAGKQLQMFFAVWSPTLSVVAGIIVMLMGIWAGVRSRAPIVCKLVPETTRQKFATPGSYFASALIAIGFSLGCLTCFGGAIIATLLIYVGSLGSALVGAAIMLAFSMGVVIPFLLAAFFLSRALPLLSRIRQYAPQIGFTSMVVIVAFGLVLVTDNFHVVSDFIYPYLGLQ